MPPYGPYGSGRTLRYVIHLLSLLGLSRQEQSVCLVLAALRIILFFFQWPIVLCVTNCCRYCAQFRLTQSRRSCVRTPLSEWPRSLVAGARLCVECQPLVMGGSPATGRRARCTGHGVLDLETRWSAVGVPGCRGKWVMTTPHTNCRCPPDNKFSFVLV